MKQSHKVILHNRGKCTIFRGIAYFVVHFKFAITFCSSVAQQPKSGLGRLLLRFVDLARTHTRSHSSGFLWMSYRLVSGAAANTTHKKETNVYALRGKRTSGPSNQAHADLRLVFNNQAMMLAWVRFRNKSFCLEGGLFLNVARTSVAQGHSAGRAASCGSEIRTSEGQAGVWWQQAGGADICCSVLYSICFLFFMSAFTSLNIKRKISLQTVQTSLNFISLSINTSSHQTAAVSIFSFQQNVRYPLTRTVNQQIIKFLFFSPNILCWKQTITSSKEIQLRRLFFKQRRIKH